jgi:DNA-binding MarR family transcriptional regulator
MNLQNFLPYQLSVLSNKVSKGISKFYRDQHGISIPEWRVMSILSDRSNQTAKELSIFSQMDKVKISRTMKILIAKKLILEKVCDIDARARRYHLTNNGIQLINEVKPKAQDFETKLISCLSKDEVKSLKYCIASLDKQVNKLIK